MQGSATSNGIVIGDNIKKECPLLTEYFKPVCVRTNNEKDRYIFRIPEKGFNYTQYDFSWEKFLKKQDFIATDIFGNLQLKNKTVIFPNRNISNIVPIAEKSKPYYNF